MFTAKSVLLRRQREEYNRFSNAAGLLTQSERTQVGGFGRSEASRAAWAERNSGTHKLASKKSTNSSGSSQNNSTGSLTSGSNSDIITQNYKFAEETSPKFRKIFNGQYDKAVQIFGDITTIKTVGVYRDPKRPDVYGEYNDNNFMLNIKYADRNDFITTMESICESNKKSGEWSTDNARHTIRHEIGHAIVQQHKISDLSWHDKMVDICKLFGDNKNSTDAQKGAVLSIYGFDDCNEMIAECIAEYINGNPRQLSNDIVGIILSK